MKFLVLLATLIVLFGTMSTSFALEKTDNLNLNTEGSVQETYKLNGQIEYDDNPVETIYLDDVDKPEINIPKRSLTLPIKFLEITSNSRNSRSALARSIVNRKSVSDILPLSGTIATHSHGFSCGQLWEQEMSYSQMEDTTAFFIRYDTKKLFSITGSIRQAASQEIGTQYNMLRIAPEWHLTDKLTIKDAFTNYVNLPKNKNEIVIVYTPALKKYADSLKFELGLAQSYYQNGKQSAAVRFSTGFKL